MKQFNHLFIFFSLLVLTAVAAYAVDINTSARCSSGVDCNIGNGDPSSITLDTSGANFIFDTTGTIIGTGTATIGWTVQSGANTACSTTCVTPCVFGVNTASATADIVDCADATADECLCAGAS